MFIRGCKNEHLAPGLVSGSGIVRAAWGGFLVRAAEAGGGCCEFVDRFADELGLGHIGEAGKREVFGFDARPLGSFGPQPAQDEEEGESRDQDAGCGPGIGDERFQKQFRKDVSEIEGEGRLECGLEDGSRFL